MTTRGWFWGPRHCGWFTHVMAGVFVIGVGLGLFLRGCAWGRTPHELWCPAYEQTQGNVTAISLVNNPDLACRSYTADGRCASFTAASVARFVTFSFVVNGLNPTCTLEMGSKLPIDRDGRLVSLAPSDQVTLEQTFDLIAWSPGSDTDGNIAWQCRRDFGAATRTATAALVLLACGLVWLCFWVGVCCAHKVHTRRTYPLPPPPPHPVTTAALYITVHAGAATVPIAAPTAPPTPSTCDATTPSFPYVIVTVEAVRTV